MGLAGCAGLRGADTGCPAQPVALDALAEHLPLRARLHVRDLGDPGAPWQGVVAAAELRDGALVVVGLTPFGARLFSYERRGGSGAEVQQQALPGTATLRDRTLDALRRTFWIAPPAHGGERVSDAVEGGRRVRRFFRGEGAPAAAVIEYPPTGAAGPATIVNTACGYEGRIVALGAETR